MSTEEVQIDWEAIKKDLENKGMKFSSMVAEMPMHEPIRVTSRYTEGLYPVRSLNIFKQTDKE